jgi:hypothetical protein
MIKGLLVVVALMLLAVFANADLTVTSPLNGGYLGTNNTLSFRVTGATLQTTVTATITGQGSTTSSSNKFTPDGTGTINGTLPITFSSTSPSGAYTITVTASSPGATFTPVVLNVNVIVTPPKFLDFTPISGRFVQGIVHIRATISDPQANFENWKVQVDGLDIPNNTGTTTNVSVDWDTSTATNNSSHSISIVATDLAGNTASQNIQVTVDRTKPTIAVTYPQAGVAINAGSEVDVIVDVSAASASALSATGIDVLAETSTGAYITRVALVSAKSLNSTTLRWTGRILTKLVRLPKTFKLAVTAMDLAGNSATPVTSTVTLR